MIPLLALASLSVVGPAVWLGHRIFRRPPVSIRDVLDGRHDPAGRPVVLCLGASLTHGTISWDWVGHLRGRFADRALLVNAGKNGSLSHTALRRLPHGLRLSPRLVVVLVGTNDVNAARSPVLGRRYRRAFKLPRPPGIDWYRENLVAIVDHSRASGAEVALVTLPPLGEDLSSTTNASVLAHNAVIKEVAEDRGADVIDLHGRLVAWLDGRPVPSRPGPVEGLRALVALAAPVHLLGGRYEDVARRRGLHVTTDGIHLHEGSGAVLAELVGAWIEGRLS